MSESTNNVTNFSNFIMEDGATHPTSVKMERIEVEISNENLFGDFGRAFVSEAYRVEPLTAQQVDLTVAEMEEYIKFLTKKRIEYVEDDCPDHRKLKTLRIPAWIQYNLSMIGKVVLREVGLILIPTFPCDDVITLEEAFVISNKIAAFEGRLQIVEDAMPRSPYGDKDVMSTAMIAGYVRALKPVEHVSATYVTAFMGMKLREEAAMAVLYRVQYDDIEFIRHALTLQRGLY